MCVSEYKNALVKTMAYAVDYETQTNTLNNSKQRIPTRPVKNKKMQRQLWLAFFAYGLEFPNSPSVVVTHKHTLKQIESAKNKQRELYS